MSDGTGTRRAGRRLGGRRAEQVDTVAAPTQAGTGAQVDGRLVDYARVFDAGPDPSLLLTPGFVICGANQAYLRATGRSRAGLYGRFMFDAFPDNPEDPSADGVANLRASLERALVTRRPDTMPIQRYDIEIGTGDGVRFEERYWAPVNVPVLDAEGRVELLIHKVEDVTEFVRYVVGSPDRRPGAGHRDGAQQATGPGSEGPTAREIAMALQTALLPRAVRSVGPLQVAARYLPVRPGLDVCGDWYDVADLGGGLMSVIVGDVVGHGLEAAAVMGQLRGAAAAALHADRRPGAAMGVLERRARTVEGALGSTAFIAVIDTVAGTLRYCNAGQVPPLLIRPDDTVVELDGARSPLLCALDEDVDHPEAVVAFEPGSALIAFTDGLVERPGEDLSQGYARLREALESVSPSLDRWADTIVESALHGRVRTDDVAMVVVRSRHP